MDNTNSTDFITRAYRLLFGSEKESDSSVVQDISSPQGQFAYVFLNFLKYIDTPIRPIDESRLKTADMTDYLEQTEQVQCFEQELSPFWYKQDLENFIGFEASSGQPVIMERRLFGYCARNLFDGTQQKITVKNAAAYQNKAIIVYPIYDREKNPKLSGRIKKILQLMRTDLAIIFAMTAVTSLLGMLVPAVTGYLTEHIVQMEEKTGLLFLFALSLVTIVAMISVTIVINRAKSRIETKACLTGCTHYMYRIMAMPSAYEKEHTSEIMNSVMPMISSLAAMTSSLISSVVYITQCAIILFVIRQLKQDITKYAYWVVLADCCVCAILLWLLLSAQQKEKDTRTNFTTFRKELFDNIETVKSSGVEDRMFFRFATQFNKYETVRLKAQNIAEWISVLNGMLGGFGFLVITLSVYAHKLTDTGYVLTLMSLFTLLLGYIPQAVNAVIGIIINRPNLEILRQMMKAPTEKTGEEGISKEIEGNIELRRVEFAYGENSDPVIKGLSLKIKKGEYIGIVGESGCGKSTLIRLLLGFETAQHGVIVYDGTPIEKFTPKNLRGQFGVVLQDSGIITGTIRMNIGMKEDADMEKVTHVAKLAAIYDEIEEMPMKFNTFLSSDSERISGGQKQRILLARALVNNPKIVILDEATSALDNISQRKIKENLDALGVTRIVIAHRLSTVRDCDRIIVLDKGIVAEEGTFDELMALGGEFAKMAKRNL